MALGRLRILMSSVVVAWSVITTNLASVSVAECEAAIGLLQPCGEFLVGMGSSTPTPDCCAGGKALDKVIAATSPAEKKALCECLKKAALVLQINRDRANQFPKLCQLTAKFTLSPDNDCNKYISHPG
ncbi:non-specific lipid-transfer protein 2-like [Diospyros lotus]|uniref:non-specific lipid-transfer protein 2-like n=1 Tax=Diospyros lotus TaxID=55363 RepID=UPI00224CFCF0|nr:non-specific lipid-transfer protein 2-like [Diospyros lotus]